MKKKLFKEKGKSPLLSSVALITLGFGSTTTYAAFNIPTDSTISPICFSATECAFPFTAKILLFEEFGNQPMPTPAVSNALTSKLPSPADCLSSANGVGLDAFLNEGLHPFPTRTANELLPNAWEAKLKECGVIPPAGKSVLEGRPGGEFFAHQRWDEFLPKTYTQTALAGARVNAGLRDKYQLHQYAVGEFGPGGLYHPTGGSAAGTEIRMHPNLPAQNPNSVWTFDGTLPPKLLMARYGETILFRNYNALPIDETANGGFGEHTITTHEHNGHNPAESDGYAHAFSFPGEFYDYRWPMILAGHDSINTGKLDIRTGAPDGAGGIKYIQGDWRETMSTHWFHDHMLDFTSQNVYKGNAAMMNYYSAIDRGREPKTTLEASGAVKPGYGCHYASATPLTPAASNVNLCLPSGSGLDWGNRDYDVNLVVADKAWDTTGQLKFNIFNTDGYLGDKITVNWVYKPFMEVRARKYRFRILNGSVARYFKIALVDELGKKVPFHMIANDGNIMQHAVPFPNVQSPESLPEQGIGERYDIIVDFKTFTGKKLYFVNLLEHENGRGPKQTIPLASALDVFKYTPDGKKGDPGVGTFMEFRVKGCGAAGTSVCTDLSMNPADYVEGKKQMIPLNKPTAADYQAAIHRTFVFGRSTNPTDLLPWNIKTDGGAALIADPHRVSAAPTLPSAPNGLGKVEVWHLKTPGGWSHPVHVHFEEGQILYRDGKAPPLWEKYARKDIYRIGTQALTESTIDLAIRFREFAGTYVEHCHNTTHEDKAMLLRWDLERPGQTIAFPTPMPGWDGVLYDPSITLPTYKIGDVSAKQSFIPPK